MGATFFLAGTLNDRVQRLTRNFASAVQSLREQLQRSVLSAIGVMVGSIAIVLLISIAKGVQADVGQQVNGLGVNVLIVLPGRVSDGSMFAPNLAGVSYLQDEDIDRILKVPGVKLAAPLMFVGGGVRNGKKESPTTFIIAAGYEWFSVRPAQMAEGRPYNLADESRDVCVIGSLARKNLFGEQKAVGKFVEVNDRKYEVIGVTQDQTSENSMFSMGGFENICYLPYRRLKAIVPMPQLHRIMVQTAPEFEPKSLVKAVEAAMAKRLSTQMFSVLTQEDLLKLVYKLMSILTYLLIGLTSIALFVGGVGIMTVMLMSVNERAKEIGVRKTVGAHRQDIFWQFLSESSILGVAGGLVGLGISYVVCLGLYYYTPVKPMVTWDTVALCFGVSIGVGSIFGLIPALRAAKKDPVQALRSE